MNRILLPALACLTFAQPAWAQTTLDTTAPAPVANLPIDQPDDDEDDDGITGLIALGGGVVPRYQGSSDYQATPFGIAALRWKGMEFNVTGPELRVDLGGGGRFLFGPAIGSSNNRDRDDTEGALRQLNPIDGSIFYGGFVGYRFGGDDRGQGRIVVSLEATKDSKSEKGANFDVGVSYAAVRSRRFFATINLAANFNDAKYTRTFFGVTEAESLASGLPAYRPGGGLTRVTAGLTAGWQLTRRWGLITRLGGGTFTGDAADSPIVRAGSKTYGQALLGLSFSF